MQQPPPLGWDSFFAPSEYDKDDRKATLIRDCTPYLNSDAAWKRFLSSVALVGPVGNAMALQLNIQAFAEACGVPELIDAVTMQPSESLPCLSIAVYQALLTVHKEQAEAALGVTAVSSLPPPRIRPTNVEAEIFIRQLKGTFIGAI